MSNRLQSRERVELAPRVYTGSLAEDRAIVAQAEMMRAEVFARLMGNLWRPVGGFIRRFAEGIRNARLMSELASLDDRTLADIGITREQIPTVVREGRIPGLRQATPEAKPANDGDGQRIAA
jgi:uncharacterized protein YjiS (DUF1127 family)